jgi:hypothetical protein
MWWRSCSVPVAIAVAQTGVTLGNAAQSSSTNAPRSMIAFSAGASPRSTARWTIEGFMPSMTASSARGISQRRMRRPAYFCSPRRRPVHQSAIRKPIARIASGGNRMLAPATTAPVISP